MFFDDIQLVARKRATLKVPPPVTQTGWRPPSYFPNLSDAQVLSFDVETKELDFDHGPGWARGKTSIVGFSVAAVSKRGERGKWYFPLRHEVEKDWNLDPVNCFGWLRETLQTPHIPKVGANLIFDVGTLTEENIYVAGKLYDVQLAEALIDNDRKVGLDHLAQRYLGESKQTSLLYEWCARAYGGNPTPKQRENIFRAPPQLVGPYGEADADLPLRIFEAQWPILVSEGLTDLFELECNLIRLLVRMRLTGVRVDLDTAERLYKKLGAEIIRLHTQLFQMVGFNVNVNSGAEVAKAFDHCGVLYPRTEATTAHPTGQASFKKDWLKNQAHPVAELINLIRECEKMQSTFIRSYILEGNVNGRVFCQFHPLRNDEGGTVTGRFSSSDPNLQNIPIRTDIGKEIRTAFVPDYGHLCWEKDDYSQIEYRCLAHFAVGPGSDELRLDYIDNPDTDYHDKVYDNVAPYMGWDITDKPLRVKRRRPIKNTNFGLVYGQGQPKLQRTLNLSQAEAREFFTAYHKGAPYVKPTMAVIADEVQRWGYITTILGRRTRFNLWEPVDNDRKQPRSGLPYEIAIREYGSNIKRAYDYRGVNYKLQGSAADVIKKAMVDCDQAGIYDVIGVPKLQVHDELDHSVIDDSPAQQEAYREMRHIMENCIPSFRLPIRVDSKRGSTWGNID